MNSRALRANLGGSKSCSGSGGVAPLVPSVLLLALGRASAAVRWGRNCRCSTVCRATVCAKKSSKCSPLKKSRKSKKSLTNCHPSLWKNIAKTWYQSNKVNYTSGMWSWSSPSIGTANQVSLWHKFFKELNACSLGAWHQGTALALFPAVTVSSRSCSLQSDWMKK